MKKQEPVMDWPAVIAALHRRGMTLTGLAKLNGLNPDVFRQVKSRTNYKAQALIADFIGVKPEEIFPSRYPIGKPRIFDTNKYPVGSTGKKPIRADEKDAA